MVDAKGTRVSFSRPYGILLLTSFNFFTFMALVPFVLINLSSIYCFHLPHLLPLSFSVLFCSVVIMEKLIAKTKSLGWADLGSAQLFWDLKPNFKLDF